MRRGPGRILVVVKIAAISLLVYLVINNWRLFSSGHGEAEQNITDGREYFVANTEWLTSRQELLAHSGENSSVTSKLLIVGYMRGGSSLFGQLFNRHPNDVLWYEPLDQFYTATYGFNIYSIPLALLHTSSYNRREHDPDEQSQLTQYLHQQLTCDLNSLPVETFVHPFFSETRYFWPVHNCLKPTHSELNLETCLQWIAEDCGSVDTHRRSWTQANEGHCREVIAWFRKYRPSTLNNMTKVSLRQAVPGYRDPDGRRTFRLFQHHLCISRLDSSSVRSCINMAVNMCSSIKPRIIAAEVLRVALGDLEPLIRRTPDIRVVYYVRDPRAIAVSRAVNVRLTLSAEHPADPVLEAQALCTRMRADLRARRHFDIVYPGAVFTIRYEDLVNNLNTTVAAVFRAVGRSVPIGTEQWLESTMFAKVDHDAFSIQRSNATATASKWMQQINYEQAIAMNKHCRSVLIQLGYQL